MKKILTLSLGALCAASMSSNALAWWDVLDRSEIRLAYTYSKPSNNGLSIADAVLPGSGALAVPSSSPNFTASNIGTVFLEPGFKSNYALGYRYLFPCSDTKFFIDYEHFQDHKEQTAVGNLGGVSSVGIFGGNSGSVGSPTDLFGRVDVTQDMVRSGFQHGLFFGPQFMVELSGYFEYDWLEQIVHDAGTSLNIDTSGTTPVISNIDFLDYSKNKTHGFGPGVGLKLLGTPLMQMPCVTVFAGVMTTVLYANQLASSEHILANRVTPTTDSAGLGFALQPDSLHTLLAKIDVDLGIDYSRKMFIEQAPMMVGLTLGVRYMNIVNVFRFENESSASSALLGEIFGFSGGQSYDWGRVGPYLELKMGGCNS